MIRSLLGSLAFSIALASVPLSAGEAAKVGDETITTDDLERAAAVRLLRVRTEIYEARRAALDERIAQILVERRAAAAKLTATAWLDREVAARFVSPTPAEVAKSYESATGEFRSLPQAQGMADLAQAMGEVRRREMRSTILRELREGAEVEVTLAPPRLEQRDLGGSVVHGADDAPVTMVVFEDYQCPFSAQLAPVLASLRERYPARLRIIHQDLPLPMHREAKKAAEAVACANEEGRFWEMAGRLYQNQKALGRAALEDHAEAAGLDRARFVSCLDSGRQSRTWTEGIAAARRYDVRGTPTLFINGRLVTGGRDEESLVRIIEEEMR